MHFYREQGNKFPTAIHLTSEDIVRAWQTAHRHLALEDLLISIDQEVMEAAHNCANAPFLSGTCPWHLTDFREAVRQTVDPSQSSGTAPAGMRETILVLLG